MEDSFWREVCPAVYWIPTGRWRKLMHFLRALMRNRTLETRLEYKYGFPLRYPRVKWIVQFLIRISFIFNSVTLYRKSQPSIVHRLGSNTET